MIMSNWLSLLEFSLLGVFEDLGQILLFLFFKLKSFIFVERSFCFLIQAGDVLDTFFLDLQ